MLFTLSLHQIGEEYYVIAVNEDITHSTTKIFKVNAVTAKISEDFSVDRTRLKSVDTSEDFTIDVTLDTELNSEIEKCLIIDTDGSPELVNPKKIKQKKGKNIQKRQPTKQLAPEELKEVDVQLVRYRVPGSNKIETFVKLNDDECYLIELVNQTIQVKTAQKRIGVGNMYDINPNIKLNLSDNKTTRPQEISAHFELNIEGNLRFNEQIEPSHHYHLAIDKLTVQDFQNNPAQYLIIPTGKDQDSHLYTADQPNTGLGNLAKQLAKRHNPTIGMPTEQSFLTSDEKFEEMIEESIRNLYRLKGFDPRREPVLPARLLHSTNVNTNKYYAYDAYQGANLDSLLALIHRQSVAEKLQYPSILYIKNPSECYILKEANSAPIKLKNCQGKEELIKQLSKAFIDRDKPKISFGFDYKSPEEKTVYHFMECYTGEIKNQRQQLSPDQFFETQPDENGVYSYVEPKFQIDAKKHPELASKYFTALENFFKFLDSHCDLMECDQKYRQYYEEGKHQRSLQPSQRNPRYHTQNQKNQFGSHPVTTESHPESDVFLVDAEITEAAENRAQVYVNKIIEAYKSKDKDLSSIGLQVRAELYERGFDSSNINELTVEDLIDILVITNHPNVKAKKLQGDGRLWTQEELDLKDQLENTFFDNLQVGANKPTNEGGIAFTASNRPKLKIAFSPSLDFKPTPVITTIADKDGNFDEKKYYQYFEAQYLDFLLLANTEAERTGEDIIFAFDALSHEELSGEFKENIKACFPKMLDSLLAHHCEKFTRVKGVVYDRHDHFNLADDSLKNYNSKKIKFITTASGTCKNKSEQQAFDSKSNKKTTVLSNPKDHDESFEGCKIVAIAPRHASSYYGAEFYNNDHSTFEGFLASQTNLTARILKTEAKYDKDQGRYVYPNHPNQNAGEIAKKKNMRLGVGTIRVRKNNGSVKVRPYHREKIKRNYLPMVKITDQNTIPFTDLQMIEMGVTPEERKMWRLYEVINHTISKMGCDVKISTVVPDINNLNTLPKGNNSAYVIVQPVAGAASSSLHYINRRVSPITVTQVNFANGKTINDFTKALFPDARNHHYSNIDVISREQFNTITNIVNTNNKNEVDKAVGAITKLVIDFNKQTSIDDKISFLNKVHNHLKEKRPQEYYQAIKEIESGNVFLKYNPPAEVEKAKATLSECPIESFKARVAPGHAHKRTITDQLIEAYDSGTIPLPANPRDRIKFLSKDIDDNYFELSKPLQTNVKQYTKNLKNAAIAQKAQEWLKDQRETEGVTGEIGILNLANAETVGGGAFVQEKDAQEEDLCETSDALLLMPIKYPPYKNGRYGLHQLNGTYLVEDVRQYYLNAYGELDETSYLYQMLVAAAVDFRQSTEVNYAKTPKGRAEYIQYNAYIMRRLCEHVIESKLESFGAGAFGCGVFNNNIFLMAAMFRSVLSEDKYVKNGLDQKFKFPVLDNQLARMFNEIFSLEDEDLEYILQHGSTFKWDIPNNGFNISAKQYLNLLKIEKTLGKKHILHAINSHVQGALLSSDNDELPTLDDAAFFEKHPRARALFNQIIANTPYSTKEAPNAGFTFIWKKYKSLPDNQKIDFLEKMTQYAPLYKQGFYFNEAFVETVSNLASDPNNSNLKLFDLMDSNPNFVKAINKITKVGFALNKNDVAIKDDKILLLKKNTNLCDYIVAMRLNSTEIGNAFDAYDAHNSLFDKIESIMAASKPTKSSVVLNPKKISKDITIINDKLSEKKYLNLLKKLNNNQRKIIAKLHQLKIRCDSNKLEAIIDNTHLSTALSILVNHDILDANSAKALISKTALDNRYYLLIQHLADLSKNNFNRMVVKKIIDNLLANPAKKSIIMLPVSDEAAEHMHGCYNTDPRSIFIDTRFNNEGNADAIKSLMNFINNHGDTIGLYVVPMRKPVNGKSPSYAKLNQDCKLINQLKHHNIDIDHVKLICPTSPHEMTAREKQYINNQLHRMKNNAFVDMTGLIDSILLGTQKLKTQTKTNDLTHAGLEEMYDVKKANLSAWDINNIYRRSLFTFNKVSDICQHRTYGKFGVTRATSQFNFFGKSQGRRTYIDLYYFGVAELDTLHKLSGYQLLTYDDMILAAEKYAFVKEFIEPQLNRLGKETDKGGIAKVQMLIALKQEVLNNIKNTDAELDALLGILDSQIPVKNKGNGELSFVTHGNLLSRHEPVYFDKMPAANIAADVKIPASLSTLLYLNRTSNQIQDKALNIKTAEAFEKVKNRLHDARTSCISLASNVPDQTIFANEGTPNNTYKF
jgi:uncharacterized protein (TIGR02452 family)